MEESPEKELGILGNLFMGVSTSRILEFLLSYQEFDYSEADVARYAGVSTRQVYRAMPFLLATGLVYQTRVSGRSKMYKLNTSAVQTQYLEKLVLALTQAKDVKIQKTLENENEELTVPQQ